MNSLKYITILLSLSICSCSNNKQNENSTDYPASSSDLDLNDGLVGWYPFNGNASDASGNGNDCTVKGASLTTDRYDVENHAYKFDGDDWIESKNIVPAYNVLSFSAWFKATDVRGNNTKGIVSMPRSSAGTGSRLGFHYSTKSIMAGFNPPNIAIGRNSTEPLKFEQWYHGAFTNNGRELRLYLNGNLCASKKYGERSLSSSQNLLIGKELHEKAVPSGMRFFNGSIDDVRIYNRTLSDSEILAIYNLK